MTIREIAQMAGVSPAAVSRYFNGGSLREEKREAVRRVVEETGYRPNQAARTMRTGRRKQIWVIVPAIHSDSVSQEMEGIAAVLQKEEYSLLLGVTDRDQKKEITYLQMAEAGMADGVILLSTFLTKALADTFAGMQIPVVVTGQKYPGVSCVYHDDYHAMKDMAEHMLRTGRKRPAFIGVTEKDEAAGKARKQGIEDALREAGMSWEETLYRIAPFTVEGGFRAMQELLREDPGPDCVLCASDFIAIGAMQAAAEAGKRIPEEIAVAGFGDNWAGRITVPSLTTVHLYYRECGVKAAEMLMEAVKNGDQGPVQQIQMGYSVLKRNSL